MKRAYRDPKTPVSLGTTASETALCIGSREFIKIFALTPHLEQDDIVSTLFIGFLECFASLQAEKLEYPKEFQKDVKYYLQGEPVMRKQFEDVEFKYLMLSDFYDFCRLTKRYTRL